MKKLIPFLLVLVLPLCFALQITGKDIFPVPSPKPSGQIVKISAKDWGEIRYKDFRIINNVFGKALASSPYKQSIFLENLNGQLIPGWQWDWPTCKDIASYPEILYGISPWDNTPSKMNNLPFRIGTKRITANFNINLDAHGCYRVTFLLWAVSSLPATNRKITHDIMIVIANHNMTPVGKRLGRLVVNGHSFDVNSVHYVHPTGPDTPICYVEFVARDPILKAHLDLSAFTDYLLEQKVLTHDLWITDIELGSHVVGGSGLVELKDYSIDIR